MREIRTALGMSSYSLANRAHMSPTRVRELEKDEVDRTIRLCNLDRVAAAFNCQVFYALLPKQSLDDMVWRQARLRAVEELAVGGLGHGGPDDLLPEGLARKARLDELTLHFVDHRKLWSQPAATVSGSTTMSFQESDQESDDQESDDQESDHSEPHRR